MCNFAILLKFQLKNKLGFRRIKEAFSIMRNNKMSSFAVVLFLLMICACVFVPYGIVMSSIYDIFVSNGNTEGYFSAITIAANVMVFFMSIFSVYGIIFSDKDREILTPLPIKKQHIFLVNFVTLYISAVFSSCIFLFPGFIVFLIKSGFSVSLLLKMLVGALFFPSMPLAVSFLIISLVISFTVNFRFKEIAATLCGSLLVCASLLFTNNNDIFGQLLAKTYTVNKFLVNSFLYSKALSSQGTKTAIFMIGQVLFSLLIALIIYLCGGYLYYSITEKMNYAVKNKKTSQKFEQKEQHNAFCVKEIKTILRSPIYTLNCLINIIFAPVAAYVLAKQNIDFLLFFGGKFEIVMLGIFVSFVIMSMNMVPSTSLSREGKCFWITQIVPVSIENQAKGRIKAAVILYLIAGEIFIFLFGMLLKIDFLYIIYGLSVLPIGAFPFSYIGLFIDMVKPKLYWDRETEAVKQNFNGLIGILAGMILAVVYMIPFGLYLVGLLTKTLTLIAVPIVIVICLLITRYLLNKRLGNI